MADFRQYDLSELIALMKANKIQHIKMGNMELEMHSSAFQAETPTTQDIVPEVPGEFSKVPTQEEFLYMSGISFAPVGEEVENE